MFLFSPIFPYQQRPPPGHYYFILGPGMVSEYTHVVLLATLDNSRELILKREALAPKYIDLRNFRGARDQKERKNWISVERRYVTSQSDNEVLRLLSTEQPP